MKKCQSYFYSKRFYMIAIGLALYIFAPLFYPYDYATIQTVSSRIFLWLKGEYPQQILNELRPYKQQYIRELNAYYAKNKRYPESLPYFLPRTANLATFLPLAYEESSQKLGYAIIFPDCRWKLLYHSHQEGQAFSLTYCDERGAWTASHGAILYKGKNDYDLPHPFFDTKTYEVYDTYLLLKLDPKKLKEIGQLYRTEKGRILGIHGGFNIWSP